MDELSERRPAGETTLQPRSFESLLAEGVKWPFQNSFTFPESPPAMPQMVSSRRVTRDITFESKKMRRPVRCDSTFEKAFYSGLDELPQVLWFQEQAPKVKYAYLGESKDYFPDVLVALTNGHVFVAEVKSRGDFGLFQTICKVNALVEAAHADGRGVFLGNADSIVGDLLSAGVRRALRAAVLTACRSTAGMSGPEWKRIRTWFDVPTHALVPLVLAERLVVTQDPYCVRRASTEEAKEIDAFTGLFESLAPVLPLPRHVFEAPEQDEDSSRAAGDL